MRLSKIGIAFGRSVESQRELRGLSQSELANMIGISQVSLSKIETAKQSVSLEQAILLSKVLGFSLDRLPVKFKMIEVEK